MSHCAETQNSKSKLSAGSVSGESCSAKSSPGQRMDNTLCIFQALFFHYWGLKSGLCTCRCSTIKPHSQSISLKKIFFWDIVLLSYPDWPRTCSLLTWASQVAKVIGMSHCAWLPKSERLFPHLKGAFQISSGVEGYMYELGEGI